MGELAKTDVIIFDDWGLSPIPNHVRPILLDILDDRHDNRSTIVTSQLPIENWHTAIGEATIANASLDRFVHNGHRIALKGESMRKKRPPITNTTTETKTINTPASLPYPPYDTHHKL